MTSQISLSDDSGSSSEEISLPVMTELVNRTILTPGGWDRLAIAIKNSADPAVRFLQCLFILKDIAKRTAENKKEQEIFTNLVKSLDSSLNRI